MAFRSVSIERAAARMSRRISLLERVSEEEFLPEVRAYLCDALPVDLLYRASSALGTERDQDTARLRRLLDRVFKDVRAAKAALQSRLTRGSIEDAWLQDKLEEFDRISRGRIALPQEAVETLHGLLSRIADRCAKEHRDETETTLARWEMKDYRGASSGWRFSEDFDESMAEAERVDRQRRVKPWGALQRLVAGLRMADPEIDRAVPPGAPLSERRLRTFVKTFADPRDAARTDPSSDSLKPIASSRDEALRDLLRLHNYLLDQLERAASANEALAAYRRRLRLAGAGASLPAATLNGSGPAKPAAPARPDDPAAAISQDLLRFLFDAGFVPVTANTLPKLGEAEPLAGAADLLPLAIVTAPRSNATSDHPVFAQAKAEIVQIMRRTGAVGGYVVALDSHGHELPAELECAEGIIHVFRL